MRRPKLTNSAVERFQCREGYDHDILWCGEIRGFGMRLSAKENARTYIFQGRVKGNRKQRQLKIGRHNDPWRLDDARTKALALKALMLNGIDPVEEEKKKLEQKRKEERSAAAKNMTLRQVVEHYLAHKRTKHGPLRPVTQADIRRCCENYLVDFMDEPIANLTRNRCLEKFTKLSEKAKSQANLTMFYLRALCNWARELHATEDGEYTILAANPVSRMFKLRKPNPQKKRTGRIPLNRVGAVWAMLQERRTRSSLRHDDRTAADLVCTIMLTGTRIEEARSLQWAALNFQAKQLNLPSEVVKNHNGIIFPMSTVLHEILSARTSLPPLDKRLERKRQRPRAQEYVFPSCGSKFPYIKDPRATMKAVSEIAGVHVSPHDLRRTFEDIAMECLVDSDRRRQLLNHISTDVHGAHYSNNPDPEALRPAIQSIADFIIRESKIAQDMARGTNMIHAAGQANLGSNSAVA